MANTLENRRLPLDIYIEMADYIEDLYDDQSILTVKEAAEELRKLSPSNS